MIRVSSRPFDELDADETSASHARPSPAAKCALNEGSSRVRRVSVDSDDGDDGRVTDARGDRSLLDDYDVSPAVLGTGNYGVVRECRHRATGAIYAVKSIEKARVRRRDHLRREVALLRAVDHPGILKMRDCYEDAAFVHIVTDRCAGGELYDEVVRRARDAGCLTERRAASIVRSLLAAVRHLHARDIVHRDIKPENVLFETRAPDAPVKLVDFGLARTHGPRDGAMTNPVGTGYYMSPAVLHGRYDRACDVWAVGVVAYILLAGYPPFNGDDDREVMAAILQGDLAFAEEVWGHLSAAARDFVARVLARDATQIRSVEEALQHPWIAGAGSTAGGCHNTGSVQM